MCLHFFSFADGLSETTSQALAGKSKKNKGKTETPVAEVTPTDVIKLTLEFKRFMYDPKKQMMQL